MELAETDAHGAEAAPTDPRTGPAPARGADPEAARRAAALYLDAWERNQTEITRLGPPGAPRA